MSTDAGKEDREKWLRGEQPEESADDFARQAARGRQELGSEAEARELLGELDGMLAERFGGTSANSVGAAGAGASSPSTGEGGSRGQAKTAKIRPLRKYYAIAATIALLLLAGYWWMAQPSFDTEAVYADAFSPYANELTQRTMGDNLPPDTLDATLTAGMLAYDRRDYTTTVDSLIKYLDTAPAAAPTKAATLYLGISFLAEGENLNALQTLADLQNDPRYADPARWYSTLAMLREGALNEARRQLTEIEQDTNSRFRERARELLLKL